MTTAQIAKQQNATADIVRRSFEKIVVTTGVGRASSQSGFEEKVLPQIVRDLGFIAGQKAQVRRAKKSIAGFKSRAGQIVGLRTTLRGRAMIDFFERLSTIVLPRVRDFTGIDPHAVDEGGVLNIGLKEHLVFPEINPEESTHVFSLAIGIVPKKKDRAVALDLYRALNIPFRKNAK
ncbi:MAG: 50S ribosomal protein L5 [Patescibacteria group bacterium]